MKDKRNKKHFIITFQEIPVSFLVQQNIAPTHHIVLQSLLTKPITSHFDIPHEVNDSIKLLNKFFSSCIRIRYLGTRVFRIVSYRSPAFTFYVSWLVIYYQKTFWKNLNQLYLHFLYMQKLWLNCILEKDTLSRKG